MKPFSEWAAHYGYEDTPAARNDYARYVAELRVLGSKSAALEQLAQTTDHRPAPAVFVQLYHIESEKGYWLAGGFGYTKSLPDAGRFSLHDMEQHNIDGCTLHKVRD